MDRKNTNVLCVLLLAVFAFNGFSAQPAQAQQSATPTVDSLEQHIQTAEGTRKVDLLNDANYYIRAENFDKALAHAREALRLSRNISYHYGIAEAYLNIGYVHFLRNKVDSSLYQYQRALDQISQYNLNKLLPRAYNFYGLTLWRKSDFLGAMQYYNKAVHTAKEFNDEKELGRAYNNIGLIYWKSGDFSECNDYFLRALRIRDQIGEPFDRVVTLNNLARFFFEVNDFKRCMEYSQRAYAIAKQVDDQYGLGRALSNLGFAYVGMKNFPKAIESLRQSLSIKQASNDIPGIAFSLSELGMVYFEQGDYTLAIEHFNRALGIRMQIRSMYGIADNYRQIAAVYYKQDSIAKAHSFIMQSMDIARQNDMKDILRSGYEMLAKIAERKGDFVTALQNFKMHAALKDTIEGRSKTERISQLTNRYENEVRDKEILELTNMRRIQELELDKKSYQIYILYAFLTVVIIFILYYYYKYRTEKRFKQALELSNSTKDKLFSIIAHDLRSPFIGLLGYTEILREDYHELTDEMRMQYIGNVDATLKELLKLLESLLEWAKIQSGNLSYKPEAVNLEEVVRSAVVLMQQSVENKGLLVEVTVPGDYRVFADPQMVYSIVRNLLSNAIKFSETGQTIIITAQKKSSDLLELQVKDYGAGIPKENIDKLFSVSSKISTTGTRGEKGTGIGLSIVGELVRINKGEIRVESSPGKGSTFFVTLPEEKAKL